MVEAKVEYWSFNLVIILQKKNTPRETVPCKMHFFPRTNWELNCKKETKSQPPRDNQRNLRENQEHVNFFQYTLKQYDTYYY